MRVRRVKGHVHSRVAALQCECDPLVPSAIGASATLVPHRAARALAPRLIINACARRYLTAIHFQLICQRDKQILQDLRNNQILSACLLGRCTIKITFSTVITCLFWRLYSMRMLYCDAIKIHWEGMGPNPIPHVTGSNKIYLNSSWKG